MITKTIPVLHNISILITYHNDKSDLYDFSIVNKLWKKVQSKYSGSYNQLVFKHNDIVKLIDYMDSDFRSKFYMDCDCGNEILKFEKILNTWQLSIYSYSVTKCKPFLEKTAELDSICIRKLINELSEFARIHLSTDIKHNG